MAGAPVQVSVSGSDLLRWEEAFRAAVRERYDGDPSHDPSHLDRVWRNACAIMDAGEEADRLVVLAASFLHDLVNVPKDSPQRSMASRLSAREAEGLLASMRYPPELVAAVSHAIEAHSFSAGIAPTTPEACNVQDADRIESLGALGIARCFATSGIMGRLLFDDGDPLGESRPLDDVRYALDHFEVKLLRIAETMRTAAGRLLAMERTAFMRSFRERLVAEIRGEA